MIADKPLPPAWEQTSAQNVGVCCSGHHRTKGHRVRDALIREWVGPLAIATLLIIVAEVVLVTSALHVLGRRNRGGRGVYEQPGPRTPSNAALSLTPNERMMLTGAGLIVGVLIVLVGYVGYVVQECSIRNCLIR